jgi:uncharacterized protein (DUF2344 family)
MPNPYGAGFNPAPQQQFASAMPAQMENPFASNFNQGFNQNN